MFILPLIGMSMVSGEYKIVDVQRESVFAGKLGQRVSESLVLEHDGQRMTIHLSGTYHTMCVHPNQRFQVGNTITIAGPAEDGKNVSAARIRRV